MAAQFGHCGGQIGPELVVGTGLKDSAHDYHGNHDPEPLPSLMTECTEPFLSFVFLHGQLLTIWQLFATD